MIFRQFQMQLPIGINNGQQAHADEVEFQITKI
jgi:hypothetical protein